MSFKYVKKLQGGGVNPVSQHFPQITKAVLELNDFPFRGVGHGFIQAIPTFRNNAIDHGCRPHIFRHGLIIFTQGFHILGVGGGAFNHGFLGIREFKALLGHSVIGTGHDLTKIGGIVHHGGCINGPAPGHAHGVVGKGVHHGHNGFSVRKVGGEFSGTGNHGFITVNAPALNFRRFGGDSVIGADCLGIVHGHSGGDRVPVHSIDEIIIGRNSPARVQGQGGFHVSRLIRAIQKEGVLNGVPVRPVSPIVIFHGGLHGFPIVQIQGRVNGRTIKPIGNPVEPV